MLNPHTVARALGGDASGRNVLAPGPGHSRADRSLSIRIEPAAADGFIVHSFASDPPLECRDYVRAALGLRTRERWRMQSSVRRSRPSIVALDNDADYRLALPLRFWNEARDPRNTIVADYLASRGLTLPDDIANDVIRFHPALKFNGETVGGMVALFRDIRTNEPCGIHRTFLNGAGRKLARKMLGRARDAAIKLVADEEVTLGLGIVEGVEDGLSVLKGWQPIWVAASQGAINRFPVLAGIEALTIFADADIVGMAAAEWCATRWVEAGKKVRICPPPASGPRHD